MLFALQTQDISNGKDNNFAYDWEFGFPNFQSWVQNVTLLDKFYLTG